MDDAFDTDIILIGAGLAGLLVAWRCAVLTPDLRITVLEKSQSIGGNHTWSFNEADISPHLRKWLSPFIAYSWDSYDVRFPKRTRTLPITYKTGNSDSLRACLKPFIESGQIEVKTGVEVSKMRRDRVEMNDGETLSAKTVINASGFSTNPNVILGYQKFVGRVIRTQSPHGVKRPIIMDATVEQLDGYRFVYSLPYSDHEMLVEDTYYTDGPALSENEVHARLDTYIKQQHGLSNYEVIKTENGVLPITLAVHADYGETVTDDSDRPIEIGMAGGYYHAVTGYSLLHAVKNAGLVADLIKDNRPDFGHALRHEMLYHKRDHYYEERFLRLLNRMLFRAAKPEKRYKVLERFYGLSNGLVERFYRNRLTKADKLRLLIGKPPVPISKAMAVMNEAKFVTTELETP